MDGSTSVGFFASLWSHVVEFSKSNLAAGIVSGVIASLLIYLMVYRIRPKILLSNKLCYNPKSNVLQIKIVNKSNCCLTDVIYHLHFAHRSADGLCTIDEILPHKPRLEFFEAYSRNDKDANYAVRMSYPLQDEFNPNSDKYSRDGYFIFTCYAKHSVSGTTTFVKQEYQQKDIQCGKFEMELSTRILVEECYKDSVVCKNKGDSKTCVCASPSPDTSA